MSDFAGVDQLVVRINKLIDENDERQKEFERLEHDLRQVQQELEFYYSLSREQSKIIELNEKLHQRTVVLLNKIFSSSLGGFS